MRATPGGIGSQNLTKLNIADAIDKAKANRSERSFAGSIRAYPPSKGRPPALDAIPSIELATQGCGYGYRRTCRQDHWGTGIGAVAFRSCGGKEHFCRRVSRTGEDRSH